MAIGDVAFDEMVPVIIKSIEIIQVAGVSESIEIRDLARGNLIEKQPHEGRPNESRAACNKEPSH